MLVQLQQTKIIVHSSFLDFQWIEPTCLLLIHVSTAYQPLKLLRFCEYIEPNVSRDGHLEIRGSLNKSHVSRGPYPPNPFLDLLTIITSMI